jgi:hypothetical protein
MFYEVLMEKRAGREKIAVDINQLRKAYHARVTPHLVRYTKGERKYLRHVIDANKGNDFGLRFQRISTQSPAAPPKVTYAKKTLDDAAAEGREWVELNRAFGFKEGYKGQFDPDRAAEDARKSLARLKDKASKTPDRNAFIHMGGDVSRSLAEDAHALDRPMPKAQTSRGREAFNRAMGLHEASEIHSMRRSPSRPRNLEDGPTFNGHMGVQPMLNDVNIANTFTGEGARDLKAQVDALRMSELAELKESLKADPRSAELIDRLLAGGRINRHQRKYLDQQYAKTVLG